MTTTCTDAVSEADDFIASLPQPEAEAGEWHSTASQREGLARLHQLGNVFAQTGDSRLAGFRPAAGRILMIGASGSGKTALASEFADRLETEFEIVKTTLEEFAKSPSSQSN